jgi:septum formation protein
MQPVITLASASPRRKLLIQQMGLPVEVRPADLEEDFSELPPIEDTIRLAEDKLQAFLTGAEISDDTTPIYALAADTIVAMEGRKIGKPADRKEAREFLELFSGNVHQVVSGLALYSSGKGTTFGSAVTDVRFAPLSTREIEWYLDTEEWRGVAAGYRIQETGARFVESVSGSYSNVMGLPIFTFYGMLRLHGYPLW